MSIVEQKTRYEKEILRGTETSRFDSAAQQMLNKFGIDITNNPFYKVVSDGAYDYDDNGIFDDGPVSNFIVYKVFDINPPPPIIPVPSIDDDRFNLKKKKKIKKADIQCILDDFDKTNNDKEFKQRLKRFKSHLKEKEFEHGTYLTIEKYVEYDDDVKFLNLEGFAYRLERLSKALEEDYTLYLSEVESMIGSYKDEKYIQYLIEILIKEDIYYIFTLSKYYVKDQEYDEDLDIEKRKKEKIQDMLDKYYGNRKKEKEYKKRIKRFKSHIVEIEYEKGTYLTVEKYDEYQEDVEFLNLHEFAFRLERLSKSEKNDNSLYEEEAKTMYKTSNDRNKDLDLLIQKLKLEDSLYITTNNYAYNQHKAIQENLKTLGKYGEKVAYLKLYKINGEEKKIRKRLANIKNIAFNTFLFIRNHVSAPIAKIIGTYVVAPVHRLLVNSNKEYAGLYKNQFTHRYTARKKYFESLYLEQLRIKNNELIEKGEEPVRPNTLVFAFKPRFLAIFKTKEGNIKVLTPKAHEIIESVIMNAKARQIKIEKLRELKGIKQSLLTQISGIKAEISISENKDEKLELEILLQNAVYRLIKLNEQISTMEKSPVKGLISTDAVSLEEHDMATKSNITKIVSGPKMVVQGAIIRYVGKNLFKFISEKITKEVEIPEQVVSEEVTIPAQTITKEIPTEVTSEVTEVTVSRSALEELTFKDILSQTNNGTVSYYGDDTGRTIDKASELFVRGGYDKNGVLGMEVSASDGVGFDVAGRTAYQVDVISNDDNFFGGLAKMMSSSGKEITKDELINKFVNSPDPNALFDDLKEMRLWVSSSQKGVPQGWLDISDALDKIRQQVIAETTRLKKETVMQTVEEIVPAHTVIQETVVPGYTETVVSEAAKRVIDGRNSAILTGLATESGRDMYDLLRRTKGAPEMAKEKTRNGVLPSQLANNPDRESRNYENTFGFTGDEKGDRASLYDEGLSEEEAVGRGR